MHIFNLDEVNWIRERLESPGSLHMSNDDKRLLLARISRAAGFENFLAKKYSSEKRFGLEGVEMMIPGMKEIVDQSTLHGVESVVIGKSLLISRNFLQSIILRNLLISRHASQRSFECVGQCLSQTFGSTSYSIRWFGGRR